MVDVLFMIIFVNVFNCFEMFSVDSVLMKLNEYKLYYLTIFSGLVPSDHHDNLYLTTFVHPV